MMAQFAVNRSGSDTCAEAFRSPVVPEVTIDIDFSVGSDRVGSIGDNGLGGWIFDRSLWGLSTRVSELQRSKSRPPAAPIVAMHPGAIMTSLSNLFASGHPRMAPNVAAAKTLRMLDNLQPDDSGRVFAYNGTVMPW